MESCGGDSRPESRRSSKTAWRAKGVSAAGRAVVAGHDVFADSLEVRKRVGYLPEDTPIYRDMTVVEFLQFAAALRAMDRDKIDGRIKEIGQRCGLVVGNGEGDSAVVGHEATIVTHGGA